MNYTTEAEVWFRRIEKLEKRYQLLKVIFSVLILILLPLILIGARGTKKIVADEVIASRIVILDQNSNPRLVLCSTPEFSGLLIADSSGIKKATIGTTVAGPGIAVYDSHGRVRGALQCIQDIAGYGLFRHTGVPAVILTATDETTAGLYFYGHSMQQLAGLSSNINGSSELALYDKKNIMRAAISMGEGGPFITLFDEKKRIVFNKP